MSGSAARASRASVESFDKFLDRELAVFANTHPCDATDLYFDLDHTLFYRSDINPRSLDRYADRYQVLRGWWRPDAREVLHSLRALGYAAHIFSSASRDYIDASLDISRAQFGDDFSELFDQLVSARDLDPANADDWEVAQARSGNKQPMRARLVEHANSLGRLAVFVDDISLPEYEDFEGFGYVELPHDLRYCGPARGETGVLDPISAPMRA